jgi:regulator of protease activity HflC (stomatin/prohibitin superfamily)
MNISMSAIYRISSIGLAVVGISVAGGMLGCPHYEVWQQGLKGKAELNRAEANRQIKVYEAQAKLESSRLEAQSEVERAKGVAEANRIVADGLKGHSEYLQYLWIDKVAAGANREIVYVPTEAGVPILEAGRVGQK